MLHHTACNHDTLTVDACSECAHCSISEESGRGENPGSPRSCGGSGPRREKPGTLDLFILTK